MARFFLDLHECGTVSRDDDGVERATSEMAHTDAIQAAREIMGAEVVDGRLCLSCHIAVRDETGATVLKVAFKDVVTITGG